MFRTGSSSIYIFRSWSSSGARCTSSSTRTPPVGLEQRLDPLPRPTYETGKHTDIWVRVREELDQRAAVAVAFTWTKGNATQCRFDWGISSREQRFRNDQVDRIATEA